MTRITLLLVLFGCGSEPSEIHSDDTATEPIASIVGVYGYDELVFVHDPSGRAIRMMQMGESKYLQVDDFPEGGGISVFREGSISSTTPTIAYYQNLSAGDAVSFGWGGLRDSGGRAGEIRLFGNVHRENASDNSQYFFSPGYELMGGGVSAWGDFDYTIGIGNDSVDSDGQIQVSAVLHEPDMGFRVMETMAQMVNGYAEVTFEANAVGEPVSHVVTNSSDTLMSVQVDTIAIRHDTPIKGPFIPRYRDYLEPGETFEAETQYSTWDVDRAYTRVVTTWDGGRHFLSRVQRVEPASDPIILDATITQPVEFQGEIDVETGLVHIQSTHDGSCGNQIAGQRIQLYRYQEHDAPVEGLQHTMYLDLFSYDQDTLHIPTYDNFPEVPEGLTSGLERTRIRQVQTVVGDQQLADISQGFYKLQHLRGQVFQYDGPGFCNYVEVL